MSKLIDLTRRRFGKLIIIEQTGKDRWGNYCWLCQCDCGTEKIIRGSSLRNGDTKSCGCLNSEKIIRRQTRHGHSGRNGKFKTYRSWDDMKQRCINLNHKYYKDYSGREITVCKRWLEFSNFLKDMGERPPGYTLERRNNKRGYYLDNCYWATPKEQARNRRSNKLITYGGRTQLLIEWAEEYNIHYMTLWSRIYKLGWSIEKALIIPVRKMGKI